MSRASTLAGITSAFGSNSALNVGILTATQIDTDALTLDTLSVGAGGTIITTTATGLVGIGTTIPGQELEVFSDNDFTAIRVKSTRTGLAEEIGGVGFSTSSDQVATINALVDGTVLVKNTTSDTERVRIDSSGNVGIGTDNPAAKLEVATSVDGEATLATFKNTSKGGTNETVDIKLGLENTIASNVILRAGKEANHGSGAATDNFFAIHTTLDNASSEKFRISSNGRVGIGTDNPTEELHITASTPVIRLEDSDTGGQSQIVGIDGNLRFDVDNANEQASSNISFRTDGSEKLSITSDGNVNIINGNLVLASGHGIDFSATDDGSGTTDSELLDDYEEGTWTPSFTGLTGASYSNQDGVYTKVGNLIYCECRVKLTNTGTASGGALQISGFPYNSSSSLVSRLGAYSINYITITGQDEGTLEASYLGSSTAVFNILENGHVSVLNTTLTNTSQVDLMIVYRTL